MNDNRPESDYALGSVTYPDGIFFRVFAPNADQVVVTGTFNNWSENETPLKSENNGYWSTEVPNAKAGDQYKSSKRDQMGFGETILTLVQSLIRPAIRLFSIRNLIGENLVSRRLHTMKWSFMKCISAHSMMNREVFRVIFTQRLKNLLISGTLE